MQSTGVHLHPTTMLNFVFYPITSLLYLALAVYFWRTRWRAFAAAAVPRSPSRGLEHLLVMLPMALHGALLYQSVFAADGMHLGIGNALSMIVWLTVVIYWLGNLTPDRPQGNVPRFARFCPRFFRYRARCQIRNSRCSRHTC